MSDFIHLLAYALGIVLAAAGGAHVVLTLCALLLSPAQRDARTARAHRASSKQPAVSVLKPLCGVEPLLYECLRSFFAQRYPQFQLVFGVARRDDPALHIVQQLARDFPTVDISVVADSRMHGRNRKVSNLINMLSAARHDHLVISDSDVLAPEDYLIRVLQPLEIPDIRLVTSLYRARGVGHWHCDLMTAFLNQWFIPQVQVAHLLRSVLFTSGVTIAFTRETLKHIGGLAALSNRLADDYWLGELVRRHGWRTAVADVDVVTTITETNFAAVCRHELRWLRTIRSVQPRSYPLLGLSFGLPLATVGTFLAGFGSLVLALWTLTFSLRTVLCLLVLQRTRDRRFWLFPFADTLAFALWVWSFTSHRVTWRDIRYDVRGETSDW